jgi:hypothetical protein
MTRLLSAILLTLLISSAPLTCAAEDASSQSAITIPTGSTLELVNIRVLWMKSAHAGDTIYLQVNESLFFGDLVAIPAGAYVQATLTALTLPTKNNDQATLHLRFDKLIFPNGYTVALAGNAQPAPLARITVIVDSNSDTLLDNGLWLHMQLAAPLPLDEQQVVRAASLTAAPGPFLPGTLCRSTPIPTGARLSSRMPDIFIPGNPGTPDTTTNGPGGSSTLPGVRGTPGMRIPGDSGDDTYDKPIVCPPPPEIRSSVPETPEPASQTSAPLPSPQTDTATLTVPAGIAIPLTLVHPIVKSSKVGSAVDATVAFPVTLGNQLAIPAGTAVEGAIAELKSSDKKTHQPRGAIHLTRMVYPNGYTVALDDANTALLAAPAEQFPMRATILFNTGWQFQLDTQTALTVDTTKILPASKP